MDTEKQQWYCDICDKEYSLKRKDKHLINKIHKINRARLEREADYECYITSEYWPLMDNTGDMPFSKYLKRRALVYKLLKKEFNENYKDELEDIDFDSESESDSDSDSDDEDTDYEDYVKRRYDVLMKNENDEYMGLSKWLEKSARVYRQIKKEFDRNYKVD